MKSKLESLKFSTILYSYLVVVWGCYRLIFQLPEWVEEMILKPLIWLPLPFWFIQKERLKLSDVGVTFRNATKTLYFVVGLGVVFAIEGLIINYLKYGGFNFGANVGNNFTLVILATLVTAMVEEFVFRGYLLSRLLFVLGNEWLANLWVSVGWTLLHLPVMIFVWKVTPMGLVASILLVFLFSIVAGFVFVRTKSLLAPIALHFLWQWPIILFR